MNVPLKSRHSARTKLVPWLLVGLFVLMGAVVFKSPLNQAWLLQIHGMNLGPDDMWSFLTQFGEGGAAFMLLIVASQFTPGASAVVIKSFLLGSVLSPLLKGLVAHPRPLGVLDPSVLHIIGTPPSSANSMPSGHAMTVAAAISLSIYMTRNAKHNWPLWIALSLFGMVVALSRVVVGAHWPADVLVGSGLGVLVALLAIAWEARSPWSERLQTKPWQFALLLVELSLVMYLFSAQTDTHAARLAFDGMAIVGLAGAMNRWICLRRITP